jgi:hypothetical protein
MAVAPFSTNPFYTNIAIAYRNKNYIAEQVLVGTPVPQEEFKYIIHTQAESYTVPSTIVGRKGRVNEVSFTGTEQPGVTFDYGLEDTIPLKDIDNAKSIPNYDPMGKSTILLAELIDLDKEIRVASMVNNVANHTYNTTLSGTSQWSDYANSNPVSAILSALDVPLLRPNIMTIGQAAWTVLRQHPKVLSAVKSTGGDISAGTVARQQMAELLELDDILVGAPFVNSAKPGQSPVFARVWGKHAAFMYKNQMADLNGGIMTWGFMPRYGQRVTYTKFDDQIGLRGGQRIRVGESCTEVVSAKDVSYLFLNAVA